MSDISNWPYMVFDGDTGNALGAYPHWWSAHWAWFRLKLRYPRVPFVIIGPK